MSIHKLLTEVDAQSLENAEMYFKLPPGMDEDIVKIDILAARKKVMGEVGMDLDDFYDDNPIFKAAVLLYAYTLYNNRDVESTAMVFDNPIYQKLINSMKDDYRYLDSDIEEDSFDG